MLCAEARKPFCGFRPAQIADLHDTDPQAFCHQRESLIAGFQRDCWGELGLSVQVLFLE